MSPTFTVSIHVSRPIETVYEAVADPAIISRYFTTGGAKGRLETGTIATWEFHDFPGGFPVEVVEAVKSRKIVLRWQASENGPADYRTTVTIEFEPVDSGARTKVSVTEEGWRNNDAARDASYKNCMGWSQMLAALKVWLEHGINLRDGAYK